MNDFDVHISAEASAADSTALLNALIAWNVAVTGYHDGRALSCFLRDDAGDLVAGIDGFTWGGYARVDVLWVEESRRGRGLGRRLLEAAESEAARRGCRSIVLDTHEFQAPDLYRKLGYVEMGATIDTPIGGRHFFFQKELPAVRS